MAQIPQERLPDGVPSAPGTRGQHPRFAGAFHDDTPARAKALWIAMPEVGQLKHFVKGIDQRVGDAAVDDQPKVTPTLFQAIPQPLVADVEAADEGDLGVADQ